MKKKYGLILFGGLLVLARTASAVTGFIDPRGPIASEQRTLLIDSIALMLSIVIPVIVMSIIFSKRYRQRGPGKPLHAYQPEWCHSVLLESFWWGVPAVIIFILGVVVWKTTHRLDPYRPLDVPGKPVLVQAVALRWKWLFIYPEQHIATVNTLELPVDRPLNFWITADAPMSSFAIPKLGGQIYAMAGMRTRLHLYATSKGSYTALNMQFNGAGFSGMHFKAHVVSASDFETWVKRTQHNTAFLSAETYRQVAQPTMNNKPVVYGNVEPHLFENIIQQYTEYRPKEIRGDKK